MAPVMSSLSQKRYLKEACSLSMSQPCQSLLKLSLKKRWIKSTRNLDKIDDKTNHLAVDMATVKIKLEGLDKRLENQEFTSRGILIGSSPFWVGLPSSLASLASLKYNLLLQLTRGTEAEKF